MRSRMMQQTWLVWDRMTRHCMFTECSFHELLKFIFWLDRLCSLLLDISGKHTYM